ncbi:hypothetical protein MKK69_09650 [Methylobacterium sp. J-026]|uniref:hypothetical protein n=1 Tax=Methylobacterium sp. J-026 TaxID=2836624 RepID=UPI001FBB915E|nr:hypothetical protein [Methylobacterium sp. J-026]MCJ2134314.1 hypothetical protein [Methylobacterium sp. J-026]
MTITRLTGPESDQDTGRAKTAAAPVRITDSGKPGHGLHSIVEALGLPAGVEDVEIAFPRSSDRPRAADLS